MKNLNLSTKVSFSWSTLKPGNYEIADEDMVATERLLAKNPEAMTYGLRIGFGAAYRLGFRISDPAQ